MLFCPYASPLTKNDPFVLLRNDPWNAQLINRQFRYGGVLQAATKGGRHREIVG
jgi:hypothetical protein